MNSRGIAIWELQTMANQGQIQRTKERSMLLWRMRRIWEGGFEQKFIGIEQEFWVVVTAH